MSAPNPVQPPVHRTPLGTGEALAGAAHSDAMNPDQCTPVSMRGGPELDALGEAEYRQEQTT